MDIKGPWKEFAKGITIDIIKEIEAFNVNIIIGIDWSSFLVYKKIERYFKDKISINNEKVKIPFVYSAYRIFSRTNLNEGSNDIIKMYFIK